MGTIANTATVAMLLVSNGKQTAFGPKKLTTDANASRAKTPIRSWSRLTTLCTGMESANTKGKTRATELATNAKRVRSLRANVMENLALRYCHQDTGFRTTAMIISTKKMISPRCHPRFLFPRSSYNIFSAQQRLLEDYSIIGVEEDAIFDVPADGAGEDKDSKSSFSRFMRAPVR